MEEGADRWIVDKFAPYFDTIEFFSWLREPDFCDDYRSRWQKDIELSRNSVPERFELASFWRLVRDPEYVRFLKEVKVNCVQLTLFGNEKTTDRYVGRKGAYKELLKATDILIENQISPRWQTFINEENKDELVELLDLCEELDIKKRTEDFGGHFNFFVHPGSCEGENRKLYPIRICKGHVPEKLIPYFLDYENNLSEEELCAKWQDDGSHVTLHNDERIVIYVSNDYDLFFNFTHMRKEWRIGNLKEDEMSELVRRIIEEDTPAMNIAKNITLKQLISLYGDPYSKKLFAEDDYKMYLLNAHLEHLYKEQEK